MYGQESEAEKDESTSWAKYDTRFRPLNPIPRLCKGYAGNHFDTGLRTTSSRALVNRTCELSDDQRDRLCFN